MGAPQAIAVDDSTSDTCVEMIEMTCAMGGEKDKTPLARPPSMAPCDSYPDPSRAIVCPLTGRAAAGADEALTK